MRKQIELITFEVPIYYNATKAKRVMVGMNWYRNAHYATINKCKKYYADIVTTLINNESFIDGEVIVEYDIYLKRKGSDGGNVMAVISKFILDGLVKSKLIPDDNAKIVVKEVGYYSYDKSNPRCEVTVKKLN